MGRHSLAAQQSFKASERRDDMNAIHRLDKRCDCSIVLNFIGKTQCIGGFHMALAMPGNNIGMWLVDDVGVRSMRACARLRACACVRGWVHARARACERARVRSCVRASERACVRACVRASTTVRVRACARARVCV